MKKYVLDACALLAMLRNEAGADRVAATINAANEGEADVTMHKANLLEVYYDLYRTLGKEKAALVLGEIKKRPIKINAEITDEVFEEAGRLKALYKGRGRQFESARKLQCNPQGDMLCGLLL